MTQTVDTPSALLAEGGFAPMDVFGPAQRHLFYRQWYADTARWVATDAELNLEVEGGKIIVGVAPNMTAGIRWTTRGQGIKDTRFVGTLTADELPPGRYEWHMHASGDAQTANVPFWMAVRVPGGATARVDLTLKKSDGTPATWQRGVVVFEATDQGAELEFGATLTAGQYIHIDQPFVAQTDPFLIGEVAAVRAAAAERVQADGLQFTALRDKDKELGDAATTLGGRVDDLETRAGKADENLTKLDDRTMTLAQKHGEDTTALQKKDGEQDRLITAARTVADEARTTANENKADIAGVKSESESADTRHKQQLESLDKQLKALLKADDDLTEALGKLAGADVTAADTIRELIGLVGDVNKKDARQVERLGALEKADERIDGEIEPLGGRIAANVQAISDAVTRLQILEGNFDGHQHLTVLTQISQLASTVTKFGIDLAKIQGDDTTASKDQVKEVADALAAVRKKVDEVNELAEALGKSSGVETIRELQVSIAEGQTQDKKLAGRIKLLEDNEQPGDNAQAVADLQAQLTDIDGRLKGVEGSGSFFLDGKPPVIPEHLDDLWPLKFGRISGWKHEYASGDSTAAMHYQPIAIPVPTADGEQENLICYRVARPQASTSSFAVNLILYRQFVVGGTDKTISIAVDLVSANERADQIGGGGSVLVRFYEAVHHIHDDYFRPLREYKLTFPAATPLPLEFYEGKTFVKRFPLIMRDVPVPDYGRRMVIVIYGSASPPYIDKRKDTETVGGWLALRPAVVPTEA